MARGGTTPRAVHRRERKGPLQMRDQRSVLTPAVEAPTQAERSLPARLNAYTLDARRDTSETTATASAALARFNCEFDPNSTPDPIERRRRAQNDLSTYVTWHWLVAVQATRVKHTGCPESAGVRSAGILEGTNSTKVRPEGVRKGSHLRCWRRVSVSARLS